MLNNDSYLLGGKSHHPSCGTSACTRTCTHDVRSEFLYMQTRAQCYVVHIIRVSTCK